MTSKCVICGFDKYTEKFKFSFIPEKYITVCANCKKRIENEEGFYDRLKPILNEEEKEIPRKKLKLSDQWEISFRYEDTPQPDENLVYDINQFENLKEQDLIDKDLRKEKFSYVTKNDQIKFLDINDSVKLSIPYQEKIWKKIPKYLNKNIWLNVRNTMKTKNQKLETQKELKNNQKRNLHRN